MLRLAHDTAITDWRREPHRNRLERPILQLRLELSHQFPRRHFWAGREFLPLRTRNHHLHVRPADVDDEDLFLHFVSVFAAPGAALSSITAIGTSRSARAFFVEAPSFFMRSRDTSRNCHCACRRGSSPSGVKRRYVPSACNSRAFTRSFRNAGITSLIILSRSAGVSIGKASSIRRYIFRGIQS